MKSRLAIGCVVLTLLILTGCGLPGISATISSHGAPGSSSSACNPAMQWKPPADNIQLNDIAMVSPTEGWAVGNTTPSPARPSPVAPAGVIYHYVNGNWVRLPETFANAPLASLSMDSPTDGWAVSNPDEIKPGARALVLHYTGGRWRPVDVPALDAVLKDGSSFLKISVEMFGPTSGWIFAWTDLEPDPSNPNNRPDVVIMRFENGVWTPIAPPAVKTSTRMFALSAVSADEAWIVGTDYGSGGALTTLFAHYVNGAWSLWPKTFPGDSDQSIFMLSPTDGWVSYTANDTGQWVLLHYDGTSWAPVATPQRWASSDIELGTPVIAISPGVTWFGAYDFNAGVTFAPPPLMEEYTNSQWQQVSWPFSTVFPHSMIALPGAEVQGVGNIYHQEGCAPLLVTTVDQGVFLHFQQGHWSDQVLP
jgi:hypothetical protein